MAADAVVEDFVTIVPVGENRPAPRESTFVTVLTVGAAAGAAEVIVRRPRGARLGLGLKFEGGSAAAEKVRRLLVQSCAEDSPAANATAPWGKLIPGDEILAIDGVSVAELTRIDCVRRLKDSDEKLMLLVRHFETTNESEQDKIMTDSVPPVKQTNDIVRPTTLPPPVPPRKLGKKNSFKDKQTLQTVGEQNGIVYTDGQNNTVNDKDNPLNGLQNGAPNFTKLSRKSSFDSHILRQGKESIACFKKGSPEEVRRLVRRLSDGKTMPPEAEVYIDLLSTEWERCLALADAESDDTGSSISTVVDRLGSMANSVENSIPSTPTMQPKTIDIQKVLNCIENIDSNILNDISSSRFLEKGKIDIKDESKTIEKKVYFRGSSTHEITKKVSLLSDDISNSVKIVQPSDKNNNNTIVNNTHNLEISENSKVITEKTDIQTVAPEKPKPMPRSTRIERSISEKKPRPISIPETLPAPVSEPLLTPTKKNCIETWLQRSEAEMKNKPTEKVEETQVPEALPRLIDFVPKPHYKDCGNETPAPVLPRPTTAPPPPPPPPNDPREDGSGASLDTIGDLDETCDVTDHTKPDVIKNETNDRKTFDSSFWEDRVNKSDAEDKSLSNDETPLPTCPRQPPDGVETPSEAVEKPPELPTRLPPRLPAGWPNARSRFSYTSRTQDARSEASVKDKIAMFSNDRATSTDHLDNCGTLPKNLTIPRKSTVSYTNNYTEVSSLDRRLTKSQDNLDELPRSYKRHSERPEVLGALESKITTSSFEGAQTLGSREIENKPLFYGSTTTLPSSNEKVFSQPVCHARSVSDDNGDKSVRKSNLEYLIEQRKKSLSKLRGLVIPEVQSPIVDLPAIKVQDTISKAFTFKSNQNTNTNNTDTTNHKKFIDLSETKWKTNLLPNNIPKYSPAFKRKSLQVYTPSSLSKESTPERKFNDKVDVLNKLNNKISNSRPSRGLLDLKNGTSTLPAKCSMTNVNKGSSSEYKEILNNNRDYKNVEIKICTATEIVDSDNDSAMSSTQSSYRSSASSPLHNLDSIESDSSRLSPRISHYTSYTLVKTEIPTKTFGTEKTSDEYVKRNVCRSVSSDTNVSLSSSAGSAATSGSQASCSSLESSVADSDKRKVSKACNSIDSINRRNILASAKCRSGRDAKLKSPVVETKFSHESNERSPSPPRNTSDRLSTLTSSVSAISNKGENRRRNKVIAETDSDSDREVNVRQRKTDFKNSRLKRNSSSVNKAKINEVVLEPPKVEDPPKVVSENIIKETKKTGLNRFSHDKKVSPVDKTSMQQDKPDKVPATRNIDNLVLKTPPYLPKPVTNLSNEEKPTYKISNGNGFSSDKSDLSSLEETKIQTHIIRLQKGASSGVGLILAGGIDCEAKDVTVHRVLAESVAAKAGLKRGAKIRSINNCSMAGLTHAQTVAILKEQRLEVLIEIENDTQDNASSVTCGSDNAESRACHEGGSEASADRGSVVSVLVDKAGGGAGLGFGLDGGRDSPQGDRPLTVKKLFAGGAAAQSGRILVGAELLSAGGVSMEGFTRTQAWAALKALPTGPVTLVLRNPPGK